MFDGFFANFNSYDLALNLLSEAVGILVTVLIVTPLVSYVVARRQAVVERDERKKMMPHLLESCDPISRLLLAVENSSDADFIEAGLEAVRRKVGGKVPDGPYNPSYELALENPHFIFATMKERLETQVQYIDSLVDLFAPHFRTVDAHFAMQFREKLRDPVRDLNEILEQIQWLISATRSFEKLQEHLESVDATKDTGGQEGVAMREDMIKQMRENIDSKAHELFSKYKSLDNRAKAISKALEAFTSSLETP